MQLLIAIVQDEDADLLCKQLNARDLRVTRINTEGGFLARGNVTLLVGVEDERVEEVLSTIRSTCHTRRSFINALPCGSETVMSSLAVIAAIEVQVGGATVFGIPVRRYLRLQGGAAPALADEKRPLPTQVTIADVSGLPQPKGAGQMNLILAIVQNEDADTVVGALLATGYRLTRINTAGGFLRRGNATLLIGVEAERVDDVLQIIQANCRLRTEPRPPEAGIPMYGATVFVLEAARFVRV
jgi:uncharacterized protein YaaQ